MEFLSVISKGTTHDKMLWAFTFYDLDRDGVISKEEMIKVTDAIHELMGDGALPKNRKALEHVERIFDNMDTNHVILFIDDMMKANLSFHFVISVAGWTCYHGRIRYLLQYEPSLQRITGSSAIRCGQVL